MILSFCLCLFSFSSQFPIFLSSYPLGTELLTICLNDTIPTSSLLLHLYIPCSSTSLCNHGREEDKPPLSLSILFLFAMVVETNQSFLTIAALLYLASFTLGYNLEIGLSVLFYLLGLFYCFGMSFYSCSSLLLLWTQCCFLYY